MRLPQRGLVQHQAIQAPGPRVDWLQEGPALPAVLELVAYEGEERACALCSFVVGVRRNSVMRKKKTKAKKLLSVLDATHFISRSNTHLL